MNTLTIQTKKANFEVIVINGSEVYVSLKSIAAAKQIDVQDVEALILAAPIIDPSIIAESEGAKIRLVQLEKAFTDKKVLVQQIEANWEDLKKQARYEKDAQTKAELSSQVAFVKANLDTAKQELAQSETDYNNLLAGVELMPSTENEVKIEALYNVLL